MSQYSEVWRVSGSPVARIEGANILRSLQRAVNALGVDVPVLYAREGASHTDGKSVYIEPDKYMHSETKPISSADFDVMVGYAVHEAGHVASDSLSTLTCGKESLQGLIASIGEEYVADNYFGSVAKGYVTKSRREKLPLLEPYGETGEVVEDAISAFNRIVLYNDLVQMSPKVAEVFTILSKHMGKLPVTGTPSQRIAVYADAAEELAPYWRKDISRRAGNNRVDGKAPSNNGGSKTQDRRQAEDEKLGEASQLGEDAELQNEDGDKLSDSDYEDISNSLDAGERDVTAAIEALLGGKYRYDVGITIERRATQDNTVTPDDEMSRALAKMRIAIDQHGRTRERFRTHGRVDVTRLAKTAVDNPEVFKRQKRQPIKPRRIWLVLDGSGSMASRAGAYLYRVAASFQQRIPDSRVYYYDHGEEVLITRADKNGELINVPPRGNTPSGTAILHVANELQKAGGGTLIHLTDGQPNAGVSVEDAMHAVLEKTSVELVNLMPLGGDAIYNRVQDKRIVNIPYSDTKVFGETIVSKLKEVWGLR